MKVLFLCTELAGYFANCIKLFHDHLAHDVLVVYFPNGPQAPFAIDLVGIEQLNRRELTFDQLKHKCINFNPGLVYVTGWIDHDYLRICRLLKQKGVTIVGGIDNVWTGSPRQRLACLFSPWVVKPYFSHLWTAGQRQYQFARRLGFRYDQILTGLYVADIDKFESILGSASEPFLLYVGRFEEIKGVRLLYDVFSRLTEKERKGWKLKMVGNGRLKSQFLDTPSIEIHDFMQPDDLIMFAEKAGGFILPSVHEPWGVVVQEFAAAGKPLILSNAVNSGEDYLIHRYNGFKFRSGDGNELRSTLIDFFHLSAEQRTLMGKRSHELARRGSPSYWVAKLASVIKH